MSSFSHNLIWKQKWANHKFAAISRLPRVLGMLLRTLQRCSTHANYIILFQTCAQPITTKNFKKVM